MNTEYHYGTGIVKLNCIAHSVHGYTGLSQFCEYNSTGCTLVEPWEKKLCLCNCLCIAYLENI